MAPENKTKSPPAHVSTSALSAVHPRWEGGFRAPLCRCLVSTRSGFFSATVGDFQGLFQFLNLGEQVWGPSAMK